MSLLRLSLSKTCNSLSKILNSGVNSPFAIRSGAAQFSTTSKLACQAHDDENTDNSEPKREIDPAKDRSIKIDVETSIRYIQSSAFKQTYGDSLVWQLYRRNHKGGLPRRKTRRNCIVHNMIKTGSPCPICRDQYLVLHHTNLELLHQFISPYTQEVSHTLKRMSSLAQMNFYLFICCRFFRTSGPVCVKKLIVI